MEQHRPDEDGGVGRLKQVLHPHPLRYQADGVGQDALNMMEAVVGECREEGRFVVDQDRTAMVCQIEDGSLEVRSLQEAAQLRWDRERHGQ